MPSLPMWLRHESDASHSIKATMHQNSVPPRQGSRSQLNENYIHTPKTLIHFPTIVLKEYLTTKDQPLLPTFQRMVRWTRLSPRVRIQTQLRRMDRQGTKHDPLLYNRFRGTLLINPEFFLAKNGRFWPRNLWFDGKLPILFYPSKFLAYTVAHAKNQTLITSRSILILNKCLKRFPSKFGKKRSKS